MVNHHEAPLSVTPLHETKSIRSVKADLSTFYRGRRTKRERETKRERDRKKAIVLTVHVNVALYKERCGNRRAGPPDRQLFGGRCKRLCRLLKLVSDRCANDLE